MVTTTQFYYADGTQTPVGPVSWEELEQLHDTGVVTDGTPLIPVGASAWDTYGGISRRNGAFGTYRPPPMPGAMPVGGKTQEDLVREQMAAQAARAAAVAGATAAAAGATATVVKDSVVVTLKSAKSTGEMAVVFGSVVGLVAFFLPWVGAFGRSASGFTLAREASAFLWLFPLSLCTCFFVSFLNINAPPRQRILRARWLMLTGAFWSSLALTAAFAGNVLGGVATFGLWITLLAVLAVTAGAAMQIAEKLRALPDR